MPDLRKKILLVDDSERVHQRIAEKVSDKVHLLSAFNPTEAFDIFMIYPDIAAVVIDACVPGDEPNTQSLVRGIRKKFTGPMIAIAFLPKHRKELVTAGCDYETDKWVAAEKILEVLDVQVSAEDKFFQPSAKNS